MLRLNPAVTASPVIQKNQVHRPVRFGKYGNDSESTDTFEASQTEPSTPKKDKGKGLPPEVVRQREVMAARLNANKVCNWLRANIQDEAEPLQPEAALLWIEVFKDEPEVRKKNIRNVFDGRSLAEGKKILEQKKQTALAGLANFPAMAKIVEVDNQPELTLGNIKAMLQSTTEQCYEYIHPREWLERLEYILPGDSTGKSR